MASNKRFNILKGAVATTTAMAAVVFPSSAAVSVTSDGQAEEVQEKTTSDTVVKINSDKPDIPYFYYWTSGENVYLSWDYGHLANRPSKIEAVIDSSSDFSNPSYIEVKPKGAEFVPNVSGDFYLRVRFLDSSGNVSYESIRKVIRNSTETREIKGLTYATSGTGVKIGWSNFTAGIKSVQISKDGGIYQTVPLTDIKDNSYILANVSEGSEIKVKIINGNGLEYNGVVFVKKGSLQSSSNISLGLSKDGTGISVDLSKTGFKKGNRFNVRVAQKQDSVVVVNDANVVLSDDKGSFNIHPDSGMTFYNADYVVTITDLDTGDVYTYDYRHALNSVSNFVSIGLSGGEVAASWSALSGVYSTELIWSTSSDFSDYKTVDISKGAHGAYFDTKLASGQTIYLLLTNYNEQGRILSQNVMSLTLGNSEAQLSNLKGFYKGDNSAEFSWDKIGTNVVAGLIKVNDSVYVLSSSELATLNSTNTLTVGGFDKGSKYNVSLYLVDQNSKVYRGNVSSIQIQSSSSELADVSIDGVSGITARYNISPGVLTLLLDESIYDVNPSSSVEVLVDTKKISSVSAVYVAESNAINISGFIPTKNYKNISLSYKDKNGETKSINIANLTINRGSSLDSFLVTAYNKAVSRDTKNIDEEGYNYWRRSLLSRDITLSYFMRNLAFVPEFMNLINSPQDLITRLYNVLVLRNPEPQGLQFWTAVYSELISKGVSHSEATLKILIDMTTSDEFANLAERLGVNP